MTRSLPLARLALAAGLGVAVVAAVPSGAASRPPVFGLGSPAYVVSAAPPELGNSDFAGEPSLGVSWKSGNALYQANTSTYKIRFDDRATPPGISWSAVSSPYSVFNADPTLGMDPATGTTLAGGDDGACAVVSRTVDDGESWAPSLPCTGVIDHPSVAVGPFAGPPPAGAAGTVAAYLCQQYPFLDQCSRSLDGGQTWSPSVPVTGCAGIFGRIKVAASGAVYVPSKLCYPSLAFSGTGGVGGFTSHDNGQSFTSWVIPGTKTPGRGFDPSVGIGTDGGLYEAWARDGDGHPVVATSTDGTKTWTRPLDLAGTVDPPLTGAAMPAVVAGSAGRAAIAFLGTRYDEIPTGTSPLDEKRATWDLYVATTYDGGRSWTTTQVTSDPVQRGAINDGGATATDARNLLDFLDAGVTREGRVVVGFADGCIAKTHCTEDDATPATSTEAYATIGYQATGRGLFAEHDQ